jgi:lipopolysaccharide biosynthesis glycosyltransferase
MAPFEYFNSGVMLFNLAAMRAADFAAGLVELVRRERGELVWPDQDALNVAARGRWLGLHPRWNCMNSFFSRPRLAREVFGASLLSEAVEQPAIRHFEGPDFNKPWHLLHGRGGQRLYREHRVGTPWPEYSLEGRSAANRLKRVLADVQACTRARRSAGRA